MARVGTWLAYKGLESLRSYVVVDRYQRIVRVHRRGSDGSWLPPISFISGGAEYDAGLELSLDELYAGIEVE